MSIFSRLYFIAALLLPTAAFAASPITSLPTIGTGSSVYPLPDPVLTPSDLWITQNGSDYKIDPYRLGYIAVSNAAPRSPYIYELWWNTSVSPAALEYYNGSAWQLLVPACSDFTSSTSGCVAASGGGTTNFLRADGSWAVPPCPVFTSSTSGCLSASGGGTTNFLRADGSWAPPAATAGQTVRLTAQLTSAATNITVTADYVTVATALGGQSFVLGNFNQLFSDATVGVGGMDTGTAPVNGFISIYAIYNPTTGTAATLGTTASQSTIYGGSNMPSGYTASALIAIWPTDGSGNLVAGSQIDRLFTLAFPVSVLSNGTATTATAVNMASIVPAAARTVKLEMDVMETGTITSNSGLALGLTSTSMVQWYLNGAVSGVSSYGIVSVPLQVAQTIYYRSGQASLQSSLFVLGYSI